jgi:hypothetical protein
VDDFELLYDDEGISHICWNKSDEKLLEFKIKFIFWEGVPIDAFEYIIL